MNYLFYCHYDLVEYHFYGEPLDHVGGARLGKLQAKDVLWLVTLRGGDLLLAGRLQVGEVLGAWGGEARFGKHDIWQGKRFYAVAAPGTQEPLTLINLSELDRVADLRFQSRNTRLKLDEYGNAKRASLGSLRLLTDETAAMLDELWASPPAHAVEGIEFGGEFAVYQEGRAVVRQQRTRTRNRKLVDDVKAAQRALHGHLACEVCGFDFAAFYGKIGEGFIEAHHLKPMSEMDDEAYNSRESIVLICSNCHSMVHRVAPPLTVEKLRKRVDEQRRKDRLGRTG